MWLFTRGYFCQFPTCNVHLDAKYRSRWVPFFFWNPYCEEEVHIGSRIQKVSKHIFWDRNGDSTNTTCRMKSTWLCKACRDCRNFDVMAAELSLNPLGISCVIHKLHDLHGCVTSRGAT